MKRIKNEHIRTVVGQYLKRRHFSDNVDSSPTKDKVLPKSITQSARQMALQGAVISDGSISDIISFSSISNDVTGCDIQYTRLKSFVQDAVDPYQAELTPLLFPLFVHVYMELVANGQKATSHKFFETHAMMFADEDSQLEVLETLQRMTCRDDLLIHETTIQFRENRYALPLSDGVLQYLLTYLKADDNVLMLQIFNNHFELKVHTMSNTEEIELIEDNSHQVAPPSPPLTPEVKVIPSEVTLGTLLSCIERVKSGPPCPTSICFYTFLNAYQGLSAVSLSSQQTEIAGGFEDSSIQLWSLTPKLIRPERSDVNITQINLAGDFIEDITERQKVPEESESKVMRGHDGAVYGVSYTPDMRYLLSASEDTTIRIWDLKTHTNKAIYRGHNYPVWDVDTSVDGIFASCSHDRTAKLWSTERTFPVRSFVGHVQDVDCVRFHPNTNYVATGSADKTVRLWSSQDGRSVRLFQGHKAGVYAVAFSPNGKYLASSGEDRQIKIWDLSSGTLLKDLRGHTDTVFSISFNTDGTMLASGGLDCTLRVWDVRGSGCTATTPVDSNTSPEQLASFPTKPNTVHFVQYAKCNLLYAAGAVTS